MGKVARAAESRAGLRETKSAAAKRALFEAAAALFREKGYDATSVDEIAERAGYSRATFFNHFGAKERVMSYYQGFFMRRVEERLDALEPAACPLERIRQTIAAMMEEAERRREDLKVSYAYRGRDPNYLGGLSASRRGMLRRMTALVEEAQRHGEMRRDLSARELASHVLWIFAGLMAAVIVGEASADRALESGWGFVLGGACGSRAGTSRRRSRVAGKPRRGRREGSR